MQFPRTQGLNEHKPFMGPSHELLKEHDSGERKNYQTEYRNLAIFRIENISYVIISYSFNFVRSPYHIIRNTCKNFIVEKYSYV